VGVIKISTTALITIVILAGCASVPSEDRKSAGFVLLPNHLVRAPADAEWKPDQTEIRQCEEALARALDHEGLRLEDYYIRFSAVVRSRHRFLQGYGAHKDHTDPKEYLKERDWDPNVGDPIFLIPFGGGSLNFKFTYNADRNRIVECQVNAPM
jgi:hypothetical protein